MLITFDIGNTNVVVGCFEKHVLQFEFRMKTDPRRTADEYGVVIRSILNSHGVGCDRISRAIMSSVVPPLSSVIEKLIRSEFGCEPLVVGPGIKTGLSIKTSDPSAVGSDRVVNAVAAKKWYGLPALVIDFGTATSFDFIDGSSNYLGGCIIPGVEVSIEALVRNTAKLPRIDLHWPEYVIGRDTVQAMRSGSIRGYHCLIEGLIAQVIEEQGAIPHIVATGGLGRLFAEKSDAITCYDPHLTLNGLLHLSELNG